jgi:hypothetical protein
MRIPVLWCYCGHLQSCENIRQHMVQLTELLGGEGAVAEMTGRGGMLTRDADGRVTYGQRNAKVGLPAGIHCS